MCRKNSRPRLPPALHDTTGLSVVRRAVAKIFEKLVYSRLVSYLEKHSILSDSQYGFRKELDLERI